MKNTIRDIWTFDGGDIEIDVDAAPVPHNVPGYPLSVNRPCLITIEGKAYVDIAHLLNTPNIDWQALRIHFIGDDAHAGTQH